MYEFAYSLTSNNITLIVYLIIEINGNKVKIIKDDLVETQPKNPKNDGEW